MLQRDSDLRIVRFAVCGLPGVHGVGAAARAAAGRAAVLRNMQRRAARAHVRRIVPFLLRLMLGACLWHGRCARLRLRQGRDVRVRVRGRRARSVCCLRARWRPHAWRHDCLLRLWWLKGALQLGTENRI